MKTAEFLRASFTIALVVGCRTASEPPAGAEPLAPAASAAAAPVASSAHGVLDAMDARTPVPLLPMMAHHQKQNMRDHLLVVQEIVAAVGAKDFDAVRTSVQRIGYSEQMGQMCEHMGSGAPGFTELALKFHRTADKIGEAAKKNDSQAVLGALSETLSICTSCHQTFKQAVVDDAGWSASTKRAPPSGAMHQ
jgi:hypothetical protein